METKLLTANDMAKVYCDACNGCGDCCRGMGDTIHLDPYDVFQLSSHLTRSFADLISGGQIAMHERGGLVLPHLKMDPDREECSFLSGEGRCSIHEFRPGFCRLFPLGRNYDSTTRTFQYFVIENGCDMPGKTKMKVTKWLGIPNIRRYEKFVSDWHYYTKDVQAALETADDAYRKQLNLFILKVFYETPFDPSRDFYDQFDLRLTQARTVL